MPEPRLDFDPYARDPLRWGASMAHLAELITACLDAVRARAVLEIGSYAGDLTQVLVDWAVRSEATVVAVDPSPQPPLVALAEEHPELELIREPSLEALARIDLPEVVIIDGDHNYYTVSEELRLIGERADRADLPLLLFHDVCWPHGRRDDYFARDQIPADYRQQVIGEGAGIFPGEPGSRADGLPYARSAVREGGARNGVLTAIEDFVSEREALRLVVVPAFFGFGAVWHRDAPWAADVAELLEPFTRTSLLERLEANRVFHLAQSHAVQVELWQARERRARQEALLRRLLESSAFALAERLSRLRMRAGVATGQSVISREEVRRALAD